MDEIALDANKTLSEVLNMSKNTTLKLDAATINFEKLGKYFFKTKFELF